MNMKISGSGSIPGGEYEEIKASGSSKLFGTVRCTSFTSSGSCKGESIECSGKLKSSGSLSFTENVSAGKLISSGSFCCDGNVSTDTLTSSGCFKCKCDIKCNELNSSGVIGSQKNIEAERITVDGVINCKGLINAEEIEIRFAHGMEIGSIGGSSIRIIANRGKKIPILSGLTNVISKNVSVANSVEGDDITLEYTSCPRVSGRKVTIGKGCDIELVQYSESIEISPKARVTKTEKI